MKRRYIVYKVTNRFDGKIYIGCHSTLNTNDRYMGSGTEIKEAIKKFGRKSFFKETLFDFDTKEEMLAKEKELVTKEFCMRLDTYNRIEGGGTYLTEGMVSVKDKKGNTSKVYLNDQRYLSGELVHVNKGTITVKDQNNKILQVSLKDPRYIFGELVPINKGRANVKDKFGNIFQVDKNDLRYLSGEFVNVQKGCIGIKSFLNKKHTEETKNKMSEKAKERIGNKNPSFGTCWITKNKENKKIKKENLDEWINQGWIKGRK